MYHCVEIRRTMAKTKIKAAPKSNFESVKVHSAVMDILRAVKKKDGTPISRQIELGALLLEEKKSKMNFK